MEEMDGPLFSANAIPFLKISQERMSHARRMRGNDLLEQGNLIEVEEKVQLFRDTTRKSFIQELLKEVNIAMRIDNEVILAFDVFNVAGALNIQEKMAKIQTLAEYYGNTATSVFQGNTIAADKLFQVDRETFSQTADFFWKDFSSAVAEIERKNNEKVTFLVKAGKLATNAVDAYKVEHPVASDEIYKILMETYNQYPVMMKLFKFSLLITPSTANVERGFSVLTLLHTKQRNSLSVSSLEKLMRLVLLGPDKFDEETYDKLVDNFKNSADRRIDL